MRLEEDFVTGRTEFSDFTQILLIPKGVFYGTKRINKSKARLQKLALREHVRAQRKRKGIFSIALQRDSRYELQNRRG